MSLWTVPVGVAELAAPESPCEQMQSEQSQSFPHIWEQQIEFHYKNTLHRCQRSMQRAVCFYHSISQIIASYI